MLVSGASRDSLLFTSPVTRGTGQAQGTRGHEHLSGYEASLLVAMEGMENSEHMADGTKLSEMLKSKLPIDYQLALVDALLTRVEVRLCVVPFFQRLLCTVPAQYHQLKREAVYAMACADAAVEVCGFKHWKPWVQRARLFESRMDWLAAAKDYANAVCTLCGPRPKNFLSMQCCWIGTSDSS